MKVEAGALVEASGTQGGRIDIAATQKASVDGITHQQALGQWYFGRTKSTLLLGGVFLGGMFSLHGGFSVLLLHVIKVTGVSDARQTDVKVRHRAPSSAFVLERR